MLFDAQKNLEKAVTINPYSAKAHISLGLVHIDRHDIDAAAIKLKRAITLQPGNAEASAKMAYLHNIRGEPGKSTAYYRKAIKLAPHYGEAHQGLVFLQRQTEYTDDIRRMETIYVSPDISDFDRIPMDVCLSIYQYYFSADHGYASDLKELGEYYNLYEDMMSFWHEQLPGHIYRISYEQLVSDTDNQIRQLLEYCELPFHSDCLAFHNIERVVKTLSAAQVREPIYNSAVARWKNYAKYLHPLYFFTADTICRNYFISVEYV